VIQFSAVIVTLFIANSMVSADPFVSESDGSGSVTSLTAPFTPFATPFATGTSAAFALCHVTVSNLIVVVAQEGLEGFGVVVLCSGRLEFNGKIATDFKVLLQVQVAHGLECNPQHSPDDCEFIRQMLSQGESSEFLIHLRGSQCFESSQELNCVQRCRIHVLQ
jgi:hypothetical protein